MRRRVQLPEHCESVFEGFRCQYPAGHESPHAFGTATWLDRDIRGVCPDCGTELTSLRGRRSGRRFLWCWKCERALRPGEAPRDRSVTREDIIREAGGT